MQTPSVDFKIGKLYRLCSRNMKNYRILFRRFLSYPVQTGRQMSALAFYTVRKRSGSSTKLGSFQSHDNKLQSAFSGFVIIVINISALGIAERRSTCESVSLRMKSWAGSPRLNTRNSSTRTISSRTSVERRADHVRHYIKCRLRPPFTLAKSFMFETFASGSTVVSGGFVPRLTCETTI